MWATAILTPLVLAGLLPSRGRLGALSAALAPIAALPATAAALWPNTPEPARYDWLLLGTELGAEPAGRVMLLLTSLVWLAAGLFAHTYVGRDDRRRFFLFYLLTLTGNLGLVLSRDAVTFYACFALMTFAAYGLVIHDGTDKARRAGRVYLAMSIAGEVAFLAGIVLAVAAAQTTAIDSIPAAVAGSGARDAIVGLLLFGLGVKAGAIPLHMWLPLAHPAAPTPASAVLSGAMIKAGLFGWLQFFPLGHAPLAAWGALVAVLAAAAAIGAVLVGLTQRDPKTLLAYSSISQMGFVGLGVGVALARPESWPVVLIACLLYALHHGVIKAALFLGVGVAQAAGRRGVSARLTLAGLALGGAALAGAPLTSGALAKVALKYGLGAASEPWTWLAGIATAAAIGTALLMGRFLWLIARLDRPERPSRQLAGLAVPWAALLVAGTAAVWWAPYHYDLPLGVQTALSPAALWAAAWPLLAALAILWAFFAAPTARLRAPQIPAGDLLIAGERLMIRWRPRRRIRGLDAPARDETPSSRWYGLLPGSHPKDVSTRLGAALARFDVAGLALLTCALVLVALFFWGT